MSAEWVRNVGWQTDKLDPALSVAVQQMQQREFAADCCVDVEDEVTAGVLLHLPADKLHRRRCIISEPAVVLLIIRACVAI